MPYRRPGQRKVKSRRYVPRTIRTAYTPFNPSTRGTNPQNHVVFRGKGFPDRLTTNLVFSDSIILDSSAAAPIPSFSYRLTSPYDPQFTLGGGQPTYYDQLATVYSRYKVNGAKITAIFSRTSTASADIGPYVCGIQTGDNETIPGTAASTMMSAPNTTFEVVSQDGGNKTVVATYSAANVFPDFTDGLQARVNANPIVNWHGNVWASPQGVDVEAPINVVVIIEYNVTFSDVIDLVDA